MKPIILLMCIVVMLAPPVIPVMAQSPEQSSTIEGQSGTSQHTSGNQAESPRKLTTGFLRIIEVGSAAGTGDFGIPNRRVNFIYSMKLGQVFSVGLGLGLRGYKYIYDRPKPDDRNMAPLFLDFRAFSAKNKVSPYVSAGLGFSMNYSGGFMGGSLIEFRYVGPYFSPATGIVCKITQKLSFMAGIAYESQKMNLDMGYDPLTYQRKNVGSLSLTAGILF